MKNEKSWIVAVALVVCAGWTSLPVAQVPFDEPRTFLVTEECSAYTSIKKRTDPLQLRRGKSFPALGVNRRDDPTHATIEVGGKRKWVALACGRYENGKGLYAPPSTAAEPNCLPFFDDTDNPVKLPGSGNVDVTPPAPEISPLGHAVNGLCGPFGSKVSRGQFKSLLQGHPDVLDRIRDFTKGRVFSSRSVPAGSGGYLDDLTDAWFAADGFAHIFCGEPGRRDSVGGLHYRGRYLQLQRDGVACRVPDNRENEEVAPGVVYSVGVEIAFSGRTARSDLKGYGLTLSAEDLLLLVTRAFAENPVSGHANQGCLLSVEDDNTRFQAVFVRRREGIRTFYPDATPDTRRNPSCAARVPLP